MFSSLLFLSNNVSYMVLFSLSYALQLSLPFFFTKVMSHLKESISWVFVIRNMLVTFLHHTSINTD